MNTYTPAAGLTPQGQAVTASIPNGSNTQAPPNTGSMMQQLGSGQELNPGQLNALTGAYGGAATQLGDMQTSDARGAYVANSNIPAMQTNYEDLAKKLFDYDQGTLNPQFAGTNPGMPSDAASFGRVNASPLAMTVNSAGLPASQGLSSATSNPKYALSSQIDQGNDIVSLLDTLNKGIGQEFNQRAGTYKNTVDKQTVLLKAISDILDQNRQTSLTNKQINSENARAAASLAQERQLKLMDLGYIDPLTGQPFKDSTGKTSFKTPQDYADAFMGGYVRWANIPNSMKISVTNLVKKQGGNVQKITDGYTGLERSLNVMDTLEQKWNSAGDLEKKLPSGLISAIPGLSPTRTAINTLFYSTLEPELRKAAVGGRITQQEVQWIRNAILPGPLDTAESAKQKLAAVRYGLEMKQKDPNYVLSDDTLKEKQAGGNENIQNTKTYNGANYKKVNGGWQKQ